MRATPLAHPAGKSGFQAFVPALALLLVVVTAYHNATRGPWILDDFSSVAENASIRQLWPLSRPLQPPHDAGTGGRPVANLSLALDHAWGGTEPIAYRITNLALHAVNALLLFGIVRRTLLQTALPARFADHANAIAFSSALLWAVHPVQTAVVDYVSQRTEALVALFYFLTLYAVIHAAEKRSRRWCALAVAACAFGMGSKETMVTAPLLVLLYDVVFLSGSWRVTWQERLGLHASLAATWILLGLLVLGSRLDERGVGFGLGVSGVDYLLLQGSAVLEYMKLSAWPYPLVFDRGWAEAPDVARALASLAACGLAFVAAFRLLRRNRPAGFLAISFFLLLAPTSTFIPIVQQPVAENRLYLPLAPLVALAVTGGFACRPRVAPLLVAAVAVPFAILTLARNLDYRDEVRLWQDTIAKRPGNARAHANLAAALLRTNRFEEAATAARAAVALSPAYPEAHNNLGVALANDGRPDLALAHYETALRARPGWTDARYNLGEAHLRCGDAARAIAAFEAVVQADPSHARAHNNLAVTLLQLGRTTEALAHAREAARHDPRLAEAQYNLGNALAASGEVDAAMRSFNTALRLRPDFPRAHNNLGALHLRAGRLSDALAHFDAALALQPAYPEASRNRALALETQRSTRNTAPGDRP